MKKTSSFLALLLFSLFINQAIAQCTQAMPCFSDAFGYVYHFSNVKLSNVNVYIADGTSSAYPSGVTSIKVDLTNGISNGTVKMVVRNGSADGCTTYSDSFIYVGTVNIEEGTDKRVTSFSGSGTWRSYCYGGVLNTGTWSAGGPCGSGSTSKQQSGLSPADGKQKIDSYKRGITTAPNPATSLTTISYSIKDAGKANITIYNSMNQPVKVLVNEAKALGTYSIQWNLLDLNGSKVPTGIYRAVLTTTSGISSSNIQVLGN